MRFKGAVREILEKAKDVKSFRIERPNQFDFSPGQYLFVSIYSGSDVLTKPLSISSSPTEDFIEVTKRLTGHEFSNALNGLKVGDEVELDGPRGSFTFKGEYAKVGMLCGGIGITPLMSMIKYCTHMHIPSDITLLYGNRSEDIPFFEELERISKDNEHFKVYYTLSRPGEMWMGRRGHIDSQMIIECIPDYAERAFYLSGPPALVDECHQNLRGLGVEEVKIKTENFIGY